MNLQHNQTIMNLKAYGLSQSALEILKKYFYHEFFNREKYPGISQDLPAFD
jgi:hypothetical protein